MTVKVSVKRSLADQALAVGHGVETGAAAGVDREAAVRAGGIAGEAQHRASWSTSLALTVPAAVRDSSSAVAPLWSRRRITDASLVPVTVMVTSWVVVALIVRHGDREGLGKAVIGRQGSGCWSWCRSQAPLLASHRETAAYVPVASPVKLSTAVVVDVAGADRPRRGQGTVLGSGAALEPSTDRPARHWCR